VKIDIVLAGVGGQGVLSIAAILAEAARREGLTVKQAEVHGMAQRGGAVQASLRLADGPIGSDLISGGGAELILGMEPIEALRYLDYLAPGGSVVTAAEPVENIPDYPPLDEVHAAVRSLPGALLIEADRIAREAGSHRAANVVMVGAASTLLPLPEATLRACISEGFAPKGENVVNVNLAAFRAGREAATAAPERV
jgi:indolepyruvate ferredoxin oxidoreductase beta subunit